MLGSGPAGHTGGVTCVRWGGEGLIYTSSRDRTIKIWSEKKWTTVRTLSGHGHWVNTMALSKWVLPFPCECHALPFDSKGSGAPLPL